MRLRVLASGFLLAAMMATAPGARAALLPDGGVTAEDVANVMRGHGLTVSIGKDGSGDPKIRSALGGVKYSVYFYECHHQPRCQSIEFSAGFGSGYFPAKALSRVNEWNMTKRFGKAYVTRDKALFVEYDIDLEHGATTEAVLNDLVRWEDVLPLFVKYFHQ
ncbi:MAG: YbjN domain-containing protein [Rhodospirillales bacterium]|nr:YbjN domain-containing protein [Rhodospirillales bacterium]